MSFSKVLLAPCLCAAMLAQTPAPQPVPAPAPKPAAPAATPPDKIILTIGSEKMTAAEFDEFIESLPEQYRMAARGPAKRQLVDQLISLKTLSQEARRRKLDQTTSFKKQMAFQSDNLLAGALFRDLTANLTVDDATARKYFEEHKNEYAEAKARHILIRVKGSAMPLQGGKPELTDEEALAKAKAVHAKLVAGADFAELAKTESDDATSAVNGGDLGSFKHGQM
ncbi:MAG: peptidylprolyl isomerase, partial [Bryobacteraceae bacterium]